MNRRMLTPALVALVALTAVPVGSAVLPTGEHFTLNVLGKERVGLGTGNQVGGSTLLVPLYGLCRVNLNEGPFQVLDKDCVNDGVSAFQLPNPDPENDGVSEYGIFVRPLGKPGGSATFTTCLEDDGETWCSTENVFVARAGGVSPTTDVSKEMLTVCYDSDGDGDYEREQIFDDENKDYFWQYDNNGLRLAQLRFYPMQVSISGDCPPA